MLLLLRAGNHNAGKWGLPGGNADATDRDLLHTATREAEEEMGSCPAFTLGATVLTQRGKRGQKHFTVFVVSVAADVRAGFEPRLNAEHTEWRWFPFEALDELHAHGKLHPVIALALHPPHRAAVEAAVRGAP